MNIEDFDNPFDALLMFEQMISKHTGAPYVVLTDSCTHAIEICVRIRASKWSYIGLPCRTYLSLPMMLHKLGFAYYYEPRLLWEQHNEYELLHTRVWDSARKFEEDMYKPGEIQCLSFGHGKPLQIGIGGAILLDDEPTYIRLKRMAYDGRALHEYDRWAEQKVFDVGYHYMMRPEFAVKGINLLNDGVIQEPPPFNYPDLREITIND